MFRNHLVMLTLFVCSLAPSMLQACVCGSTRPFAHCETYQATEIVFSGQVVQVSESFVDIPSEVLQKTPPEWIPKLEHFYELSPNEQRELLIYYFSSENGRLAGASNGVLASIFNRLQIERKHRVRLRVTELFRGTIEQEVEIKERFSDCDVNFQNGKSYLVYLSHSKRTLELETSVCAGTELLDRAQEQIDYARAIKSGELRSRIFGVVTSNPDDLIGFKTAHPVASVLITAQSNGNTWQTVSGQDGTYELYVAPGSIDLSAELPDTPEAQTRRRVELRPEFCSRQDFLSLPVGAISGRVVDASGNPVQGVLVEIQAITPTRQPLQVFKYSTDNAGKFEHKNLESGKYLIGVNLTQPPKLFDYLGNKEIPYPRTYFPGVAERSLAQALSIEGYQKIEDLVLQLPEPLERKTFTGTVSWPDGSPASRALVELLDLDYPNDSCEPDFRVTNDLGNFAISGLVSRPYLLVASIRINRKKFQSEPIDLRNSTEEKLRLVLGPSDESTGCSLVKSFKQ